MATLLELNSLFADSNLHDKVKSALIIAVQDLIDAATPTADDQKYAAKVFSSPSTEASKAVLSVLAVNSGVTLSAIGNATDAAIKANVANVLPTLVVAFNAGV